MTENNVAAQAGDEPMRAAPVRRTENGFVVHHRLEELVRTYGTLHVRAQKRRDVMAEIYEIAAAQVSPRATADVEREKLPHGHREDFYLLANARSLGMNSIHTVRSMPNWVLAMKLFATGSTSAHEICVRAGIDPDGYRVERATTKPGA